MSDDKKFCEHCGGILHIHKTRNIKSLGKKVKQYKCSNKKCGRYATFDGVNTERYDIVDDSPGPKILVLDIETAPSMAYVWNIWEENIGINQIDSDWHILCWSAKWLNSKEMFSDALINHKEQYKKNKEDDSSILTTMWKLLDEADITITHNGDKFDISKLNTRFLFNGMGPPSPYRSIDTLKISRNIFGFTSNKLAYISEFLGVGSKIDTGGFELWKGCMSGDPESWARMIEYNKNDVTILEDVYLKIRPWMKNHPNLGVYNNEKMVCTACGSENVFSVNDKFAYTNANKFQCYKCMSCGHYMRGRSSILKKVDRENILV